MDPNYYDNPSNEPTENPEPNESSQADSNVAILPKSFFPSGTSLAPGATCTLRVDEVREDQVLVSYTKASKAPAPPPMDEEMMGLME